MADDLLQIKAEQIAKLNGSFLLFVRTFYPLLTGREFILSNPLSRESHFITVSRALTKCARLQARRLIINIPPGHGKSIMCCMWIAWTLSMNPDSRFLYISYSHTLAASHTDIVRRIVMLREYRELFNIELRSDSKAKDFFQTTAGGAVAAFGSGGAITGRDAGLPGLDRFSGALIIDDPHKPDEVHSDVMRESIINNYRETIQQRLRSENVPMIFIGQRLHEDDLAAHLLNGKDGLQWESVILQSLDGANNALYPEVYSKEQLLIRQQFDPYMFSAQHQQNPQPAGGGLFNPNWFIILDFEPDLISTFITVDTAETSLAYNDATVFSFWGVYEIESEGYLTGNYGLHWIDCMEVRVEPKDLRGEFMRFWASSCRHKYPPGMAAIEKKSTGTTLVSVLQDLRGLQIREIERNRASGSKVQRFLETQPFAAEKRITFTKEAKHIEMCKTHMSKITANDSHRHDDIADTLADACRIAFIEKTYYKHAKVIDKPNEVAENIAQRIRKLDSLKGRRYGSDF